MDYKFKWYKSLLGVIVDLGIILLPNIYLLFKGLYFEDTSIIKKVSFIFISICLIIFPLVILKPKHYLLFTIVFVLLVPFEIVSIYVYGSGLNAGIIIATINTSVKETIEFIKLFLPFVIFGIIVFSCYLFILIRKVKGEFSLSTVQRMAIAIVVLFLITAMWGRDIIISHNTLRGLSTKEILIDGTNNFKNKFSKIFPISSFIQTAKAIEILNESENYEETISNFKFQSHQKDSYKANQKYILIIGESSRRENYQLYGYRRNTNPELIKINNLEIINDATASSNLTTLCFPLILTRATPQKFDISNKEKTLVSAFKESGFKAYWISNQGVYNSNLARFVVDVDKVYNLNSFFDIKGRYDEAILPYLDSIFNKKESKQLIVINLMGSHFSYNLRYPKEYAHFKPDLEGNTNYFAVQPSNKDKLVNSYDNSIVYTDFIIASVIRKLQSTNSVSLLFYLSDHGEDLYDDSQLMFGHGNNNPTPYEIRIPFIIWHSIPYDSIYSEKVNALKNNKIFKVSSSNVFHSFIDGANIKYKGEDLSKSLMSDKFKEDSTRYILLPNMNVIEYDRK
mgnify:CR=1 FL=1